MTWLRACVLGIEFSEPTFDEEKSGVEALRRDHGSWPARGSRKKDKPRKQ